MSQQIEIYQSDDGGLQLSVACQDDSVWLSQADLSLLFNKNKRTISEHIGNIFKDSELAEEAVVRNFQSTAADGKSYQIKRYNLDLIISVGYRVKSPQGIKFRQWASKILKQHLLQGYTINQQRFEKNAIELKQALTLINKVVKTPALDVHTGRGLVEIISRYTQTFLWLQQYDEGLLEEPQGQIGGQLTPLNDALNALAQLKQDLMAKGEASTLFAQLRADGLSSIWGTLEQSIFGEPAYPSIESKAAHLLYFVVKNHPFADGNKRSGAFLFIDFLYRNQRLFNVENEVIINDSGLAAITLLVAESEPKNKETMIHLIMHILAQGNP
ncbi:cytochrome c [Gammaproteobacteria bacterium]|nr:cytochrome c [Gammaproteobacteria bacterium]